MVELIQVEKRTRTRLGKRRGGEWHVRYSGKRLGVIRHTPTGWQATIDGTHWEGGRSRGTCVDWVLRAYSS